MRALVTGSAGFVGPYLVRALLERGWKVIALDAHPHPAPSGIPRIVADVARIEKRHLRGLRLDAVFHLAGLSHVPTCDADPDRAFDVHAQGTVRLLRLLPRDLRFLHVSSGDLYGKARPDPIPENAIPRPTNAYAASKACGDALAASHLPDRDVVILRPFNHIGPGQSDRFVAPAFATQIARAEAGRQPPLLRVGNLSPVRDFLDVRDVVRAYLTAFEKARPGVYNVSSGVGTSIRDILDMLIALARIPLGVAHDTALRRAGEPDARVGDPTRFRRETGWVPRIPLRKTLEEILDYERARVSKTLTSRASAM